MTYSFSQWLFIFYLYCFVGWIWESLYVSTYSAKWVNRGFMHGPFLPIYGSGAVSILLFTLHFKENVWLVALVGMLAATILEYCTGAAMEKMFHVRYWDYSNEKLNLNGHICLKCSLCWAFFSVILTFYLHAPVERMVLAINSNLLDFFVFLLTVYISSDMTISVREALNLKEFLMKLEANNEEFRKLQERVGRVSEGIKEKSEVGIKALNGVYESVNGVYESGKEITEKKKEAGKAAIMANIDKSKMLKDEVTAKLKSLSNLNNKDFRRVKSLLERNPSAASKMHYEAFKQVLGITEDK